MRALNKIRMTGGISRRLEENLVRSDGQEDVCLAIYRPSTGALSMTGLMREVIPPLPRERRVHGNASFTGDYVLRAAKIAAENSGGVAILHSHPGGRGWQRMSGADADAERSYAYLVNELTGLPLLGLTLSGEDRKWSARSWNQSGEPTWCESVHIVDSWLDSSWNDERVPRPVPQMTQVRTVSGWGEEIQADIARLRLLVVGAGTVGLDIAARLVASGFQNVAVMDFDTVEILNLDRLLRARRLDSLLRRSKAELALRVMRESATAERPHLEGHELSICEDEGMMCALDYDLIFSCVDRPWPRAILNLLAYSDLIPVIDGGIHIDPFEGGGMRNATWRSHIVRPGQPCMSCNKQLKLGLVPVDRDGLLDDPRYIDGLAPGDRPARQNVAMLAVSVTASLLAQFVSYLVAPGGFGDPGPLQYVLSTHQLDHLTYTSRSGCYFEKAVAEGDNRLTLTSPHRGAREVFDELDKARSRLPIKVGHRVDDALHHLRNDTLPQLFERLGS